MGEPLFAGGGGTGQAARAMRCCRSGAFVASGRAAERCPGDTDRFVVATDGCTVGGSFQEASMSDLEQIREAIDKIANALEILAERTVHEIGKADAEAVMHLADEARR